MFELRYVFFLVVCRLFGVFGVSAGLRKIGIRGFQYWVLVAMSKLALHGGVAGRFLWFILLYRALTSVLIIGKSRIQIVFEVSHESSFLASKSYQPSTVAYRETFTGGKG